MAFLSRLLLLLLWVVFDISALHPDVENIFRKDNLFDCSEQYLNHDEKLCNNNSLSSGRHFSVKDVPGFLHFPFELQWGGFLFVET